MHPNYNFPRTRSVNHTTNLALSSSLQRLSERWFRGDAVWSESAEWRVDGPRKSRSSWKLNVTDREHSRRLAVAVVLSIQCYTIHHPTVSHGQQCSNLVHACYNHPSPDDSTETKAALPSTVKKPPI